MQALDSAHLAKTYPHWQTGTNLAVKLLRMFREQLEALNRYRGKGHQKVTVEHVHVNAGGQAIVGHLEATGGGGSGDAGKA